MNVTATLVGQMMTFAVLVWFIHRFLWGPLTRMMAERSKRIADGLAAGERGKHELELATNRSVEILREGKQQVSDIIAQAEKRALQIIEDAKQAAKSEGDRIIAGAKAEITQEVSRAKEALRGQVSALAVAGAEKILRREVDAKVHADLLKSIESEL
ncbi:MAG TPA: F0F1 ATP synthase subunit B [Burkholderiales bacterium]|nr:F0F1 ATP synthase subunit B [Burkholderiales bacterium]